MVCFFGVFFTKPLTSGILFSIIFNSVLFTKLLISGILFSTAANCVLVAKPLTSGILPSAVVILPSISVIFELKVLVCNNPLIPGIFNFSSPTSLSYLVLETNFVVSVPPTFSFKVLKSVF